MLVDPWLVGSCYWRSWYNFPMPEPELIRNLAPNWIYLTHIHWDHFHGPSLRRFPPDRPVLVPLQPMKRMIEDLKTMGFTDVREIPHGGRVELAPGFHLHSFGFGVPWCKDSVVVLQDARTTLLNANDCKIFGMSLRQITRRFPRVDFVLRSHSSASPYPFCIEGYEKDFKDYRSPTSYIEEFAAFARAVRARYAIPFASSHCFVHRETRQYNALAVRPNEVAAYMNPPSEGHPECVVMPSGSTWSDTEGFRLRDFDYSAKSDYVQTLLIRHADSLAAQYRREADTVGDFLRFRKYFHGLFDALIWFLRRMLPTTVFTVEGKTRQHWLVDFAVRRVEEVADDRAGQLVITISALVLNDCVRKRMFSVLGPSKRLRIRLRGVSMRRAMMTTGCCGMYADGALPLRRLFGLQALSAYRKHWREVFSLIGVLISIKITGRVRSVADLYRSPMP